MNPDNQSVLKVGDQVVWVGAIKTAIASRTGTIVEVLPNHTMASYFASYRILRDDGLEGIYYRTQLELVSVTDPTPPEPDSSEPVRSFRKGREGPTQRQ